MPSDDYAYVGGGALKLKGAKVKKNKKRKDRPRDLERALSTSDGRSVTPDNNALTRRNGDDGPPSNPGEDISTRDPEQDDSVAVSRKTEAERRFDEAKRKKVGEPPFRLPPAKHIAARLTDPQLLEMAESAAARPELLKTHKERVEELNTYLSRLSEHHDMPKIGPG